MEYTDNLSLGTANRAITAFISDNSNRSRSFTNLKRKMEDYRTVTGITEVGDIIVSSWGQQLIVNPSDYRKGKTLDFEVVTNG
jgi:hypothetical protein